MNAAARDDSQPDAPLAETAYHESPHGVLRFGQEGIDPMPHVTEKAAAQRYTFSSGSRPLDGFTIKRAIGRGGFGEVYYATSDAGKEVALKLITRNLEVERRGVVQCMNLKSPHLVAIHDMKQNDDGDTFVIMEYIAGPSLAQVLAQHPAGLPANEIRMWLKGLVDGVAYLHDHGIVHRDLKPANLFLEEGVVKIGDYGLAKAITAASRDPGHSECVGTCHYMAPETSTGKYHKPIDVYAIGVILYEMVTGRVPFDGESVGEVLMKHLTSRPDISVLPEPFKAIVTRALAKDPNHRPQRVTDLLLPGDARKEPELRFIGEKAPTMHVAGAGTREAVANRDDILRITDEPPVFYIGPETRPTPNPQPTRSYSPWVWINPTVRAVKNRRAARQNPTPEPRPAQAARAVTPNPAPRRLIPTAPIAFTPAKPAKKPIAPLGPPPELPPARVRLAELAGSMFWAAPAAALGSTLIFPVTNGIEDGPTTDPRMLGLAFGMSLLATWMSLTTGKLWEAKSPNSRVVRRMIPMILGALVGLAGFGLAEMTNVAPSAHHLFQPELFRMLPAGSRVAAAGAAEYAAFFALVGLLAPGWKAATRDRKSRLRILPFVWTGIVGTALCALFPAVLPVGGIAVAVASLATPLVSPYSRAASDYAKQAAKLAA